MQALRWYIWDVTGECFNLLEKNRLSGHQSLFHKSAQTYVYLVYLKRRSSFKGILLSCRCRNMFQVSKNFELTTQRSEVALQKKITELPWSATNNFSLDNAATDRQPLPSIASQAPIAGSTGRASAAPSGASERSGSRSRESPNMSYPLKSLQSL